MEINLAKSAGFCFGVKRALSIAFKTARTKNKIEMLGNIVHNEDVIKQVVASGIKKVNSLKDGKAKTLLIRAHGAPRKTYKKANQLGYKLVDATCPMVKEIHKIAKDWEKKGYQIIIVGDKKHDEVKGISGQLQTKAIVVESKKDISNRNLRKFQKAVVVVQSTQNAEKVVVIFKKIKKHIKNLKIFNTICKPTIRKQEEIKKMPLENDVMLIIGSRTSANTKRLYEISKSLNKKSHWVAGDYQIKPQWFKNAKKVGITAGASTPASTTKKVIKRIKELSKKFNF